MCLPGALSQLAQSVLEHLSSGDGCSAFQQVPHSPDSAECVAWYDMGNVYPLLLEEKAEPITSLSASDHALASGHQVSSSQQ